MDYDKLIHCLKCCARVGAQNEGCNDCGLEYCGEECQQLCGTAATALEASWHENQALRGLIKGLDAELSHVRADLARVTAERDAAVSDIETALAYGVENCELCANSQCHLRGGTKPCLPKWRGIKED